MAQMNETESKTQARVLKFFQDELGYASCGNMHHKKNGNVIVEKLMAFLAEQGRSERLAAKAIDVLIRRASNLQQGAYKANQDVYSLLKYGAKVAENPGEPEKTVYFINWDYPHKNHFAVAEEVTIKHNNVRRPDLVLYINGIAVAIIELKRSSVSVAEGIRQSSNIQSEHFNKPFFSTIQFVMAGNDSEGLRYGTTGTEPKHFLEWKNDTVNTEAQPLDNESIEILEKCTLLRHKLDRQIYSIFHKWRLLDLIHNFFVFDKGTKKLCRHNQFFGVKKAMQKLGRKQGGILWHTQGSGKTLTMVWLSKLILANNPDARVLMLQTARNWTIRWKRFTKA